MTYQNCIEIDYEQAAWKNRIYYQLDAKRLNIQESLPSVDQYDGKNLILLSNSMYKETKMTFSVYSVDVFFKMQVHKCLFPNTLVSLCLKSYLIFRQEKEEHSKITVSIIIIIIIIIKKYSFVMRITRKIDGSVPWRAR